MATSDPQWREQKVRELSGPLITRASRLETEIEDEFEFDIKPLYTQRSAFLVWASITSLKVIQCVTIWTPKTRELARWRIAVGKDYQGQGIATKFNHLTQHLAEDLDSSLDMIGILKSSLAYWDSHPDYDLYKDRQRDCDSAAWKRTWSPGY